MVPVLFTGVVAVGKISADVTSLPIAYYDTTTDQQDCVAIWYAHGLDRCPGDVAEIRHIQRTLPPNTTYEEVQQRYEEWEQNQEAW